MEIVFMSNNLRGGARGFRSSGRKYRRAILLLVGLITMAGAASSSPLLAQNALSESPPNRLALDAEDIRKLIHEADVNGTAMHKRLVDFTYTLKKTKRVLNDKGKTRNENTQVFEAFPLLDKHLLVHLKENDVYVSPWAVARDRQVVGEALEKAEREGKMQSTGNRRTSDELERYLTAGIEHITGKYVAITIDPSEFLRSCEFDSPRRELVRGRDTIVLNFHPRAGAQFNFTKTFMSKTTGVVWIDAKDKVLVRLEGRPVPPVSNLENNHTPSPPSNAALLYQQARTATGLWFPSLIRMNAAGDATFFNRLNWDVLFEFEDYKHFDTSVGGVTFDAPVRKSNDERK
jgi:hypothetical protein